MSGFIFRSVRRKNIDTLPSTYTLYFNKVTTINHTIENNNMKTLHKNIFFILQFGLVLLAVVAVLLFDADYAGLGVLCVFPPNELTNRSKNIHPYFISGFIDGEGCFTVSIIKRPERKLGWQVIITFQIGLSPKDKDLLNQIQGYFGVGKIYKEGEKTC